MPTISGLRRRGYTPNFIRNFCQSICLSRAASTVDIGMLEYSIRADLSATARRYMAVINPIKIIIKNYPKNKKETFEVLNHSSDITLGTRKVDFGKELYIERSDFLEHPSLDSR